MPSVEVTTVVKAGPREAYEIGKDMEKYPQFMPSVKSVVVIERGDNYTVTQWDTDADGRTFSWTEKDVFDDANCHINYEQVKGDLKELYGEWRFEPAPEGTRVVFTVNFELGIPMLATLLNPYLKKVVRKNGELMLMAIKEKFEG